MVLPFGQLNFHYLRTAKPPISLYLKDSAWAMAHRPLVATFSAYSSTDPSEKPNLFCTTEVSSRIRRPFSPKTFWVLVARMMISVRVGAKRTYTTDKLDYKSFITIPRIICQKHSLPQRPSNHPRPIRESKRHSIQP